MHFSVVLAYRCKVFIVFQPPFTTVPSQTFAGPCASVGLVDHFGGRRVQRAVSDLSGCAASLSSQKCYVIVCWAATSRIKLFHSRPFVFQRQKNFDYSGLKYLGFSSHLKKAPLREKKNPQVSEPGIQVLSIVLCPP